MSNFIKRILAIILCLAAAILFTILGINQVKDRKAFTETTATITEITSRHISNEDYEYYVEVTYTVDGEEYVNELGEYSSSMHEGDEIQIKYNPENPNEIVTASYFAPVICFVMAGIGVIGFFCALIKLFR